MSDDEVGYKKPPKHGQIRKGERRNPNGRRGNKPPKPARESDADIIRKIEGETVAYEVRSITKREVLLRVLVAKAYRGDMKAMSLLEAAREKSGANKTDGGVLFLPSPVPLEEWEASAAAQQAQFREADPAKKKE